MRKRPHCHTCGAPMAGHRRHDGYPICPTKQFKERVSSSPSLASPPPTPPREASPSKSVKNAVSRSPPQFHPSLAAFPPPFEFPESGPWHRRNPNWEEPEPIVLPSRDSAQEAARHTRGRAPGGASFVSTVLVDDDGHTIHASDGDVTKAEEASFSSRLVDRVALADPRVVRVVGTPRGDEDAALRVQEAAAKRGVHTGLIHIPTVSPGGGSRVKKEHSWWMVLGRDSDVVNEIVDAQKRPRGVMPGVVGDLKVEGPRMATFLQLILAGFIGGVVAVYGLSLL